MQAYEEVERLAETREDAKTEDSVHPETREDTKAEDSMHPETRRQATKDSRGPLLVTKATLDGSISQQVDQMLAEIDAVDDDTIAAQAKAGIASLVSVYNISLYTYIYIYIDRSCAGSQGSQRE